MTLSQPQHSPQVSWSSAAGVACLVLSLCLVGCGKKEDPPTGSAQPAPKTPRLADQSREPQRTRRHTPVAPQPAPTKPKLASKPAPPADKAPPPVEKTPPTVEIAAPRDRKAERAEAADPAPAAVAQRPPEQPAPEAAVEPAPAREPDEAVFRAEPAAVEELKSEATECELALRRIRNARRSDPHDVALLIEEARTLRLCGEVQGALSLLLEQSARARTTQDVAREIAEIFRLLSEPGKAAMAWELRYMHHPTAWSAATEATQAWLEAGERETARWWYELARAAAPDAGDVRALARAFR